MNEYFEDMECIEEERAFRVKEKIINHLKELKPRGYKDCRGCGHAFLSSGELYCSFCIEEGKY
jgi:hypothetical protein